MSLWRNLDERAKPSRVPSMMLAWFRASRIATSERSRRHEIAPMFAWKPVANVIAASRPVNSASLRSSCTCTSSVPLSRREPAQPVP